MIDVKELRVGNHVDVRISEVIYRQGVRICRINDDNEVCYEVVNDGLHSAWATHLQPIPLTAELLTEIGFIKRTRYDNDKDYYIDAESTRQMERTRLVIPQIEIQNYSEVGNPELWETKIISTDNDFAVEHKATVRHLHELENFVYMTLHKELIED